MTIGNMCVKPHTRAIKASYLWNIDAMQDAEGTWRYAVKEGGFPRGTVRFSMYSTAIDIGDVLVCVYRSPHPSLLLGLNSGGEYNMRGCEYLAGAALTETMGWVAGRITDIEHANHELAIHRDASPVTLVGCGNYTPDIWEEILDMYNAGILQYPWIAGDSYPSA